MDESIDHVQSSAVMFKHDALKVSVLWYLFKPDDKFATNISEVEMSVRLRNNEYWVKSLDKVSFGFKDYQYETFPEEILGFSKKYFIIHDHWSEKHFIIFFMFRGLETSKTWLFD